MARTDVRTSKLKIPHTVTTRAKNVRGATQAPSLASMSNGLSVLTAFNENQVNAEIWLTRLRSRLRLYGDSDIE
jgi:hypothetical protein